MNQASLTPDRVERVILIGPAGVFVGGLAWVFLRAMLKRTFSRKKQRDITDLLGKGAQLEPNDRAWGALMSVTLSESARPKLVPAIVFSSDELEAIRAPTLLMIGEKEVLYEPHRTLQRAVNRMPRLSGAIIRNAHHLAALAQPDEVNRGILAFLQTEHDGWRV